MKSMIACISVIALVACSSEAAGTGPDGQGGGGPAGGCDDITGNYELTATRSGGDCPEGDAPSSKANITIGKNGEAPSVFLPGVNGGCDGTLDPDSCRFQAQCIVTENGVTQVTYNLDYTFAGKTFTGSLVGAAAAGVLADEACTATVKHEGARL